MVWRILSLWIAVGGLLVLAATFISGEVDSRIENKFDPIKEDVQELKAGQIRIEANLQTLLMR